MLYTVYAPSFPPSPLPQGMRLNTVDLVDIMQMYVIIISFIYVINTCPIFPKAERGGVNLPPSLPLSADVDSIWRRFPSELLRPYTVIYIYIYIYIQQPLALHKKQ